MNFYTVWRISEPDKKIALAEKVGTQKDYLSRVAHGASKPSKALTIALGAVLNSDADTLFPNGSPKGQSESTGAVADA